MYMACNSSITVAHEPDVPMAIINTFDAVNPYSKFRFAADSKKNFRMDRPLSFTVLMGLVSIVHDAEFIQNVLSNVVE